MTDNCVQVTTIIDNDDCSVITLESHCTDTRRAKLGKIQGRLQRCSQDLAKGRVAIIFNFYAIKISTFWNFFAKRLKKAKFKVFHTVKRFTIKNLYAKRLKGPTFKNFYAKQLKQIYI